MVVNHLFQVTHQEAAELELDLENLTSSLVLSTRAEASGLEGKTLDAPVTALCLSLQCHHHCGRGDRPTTEMGHRVSPGRLPLPAKVTAKVNSKRNLEV
jgi:hypothetical protein